MAQNSNNSSAESLSQRRIALITQSAPTIANFRGSLVQAMVGRGYEVVVLAPDHSPATRSTVTKLGAIPMSYSLSRASMNPVRDLVDLWRLFRLIKRINPGVTFSFTAKPAIYGTIAARLAKVPRRLVMIEGAGHVFTDYGVQSVRRDLIRFVTLALYTVGLRFADSVFLLNRDDVSLFRRGAHLPQSKIVQIDGIGLDLNHYQLARPTCSPIRFLLVARFLKEKGIYEYIEAARTVKKRHPEVEFLLVGDVDVNPSSVTLAEIDVWRREGFVEIVGHVSDVRPIIARTSVFVLPSYREGLPRSTQEAMAMGRPVITTDVPGCRETVVDGQNGFIVPVRDASALADAMLRFVADPSLIEFMGRAGYQIACERFNVDNINATIIDVLNRFG